MRIMQKRVAPLAFALIAVLAVGLNGSIGQAQDTSPDPGKQVGQFEPGKRLPLPREGDAAKITDAVATRGKIIAPRPEREHKALTSLEGAPPELLSKTVAGPTDVILNVMPDLAKQGRQAVIDTVVKTTGAEYTGTAGNDGSNVFRMTAEQIATAVAAGWVEGVYENKVGGPALDNWASDHIGAPEYHDYGYGGYGTVVVIDTGIDSSHESLDGSGKIVDEQCWSQAQRCLNSSGNRVAHTSGSSGAWHAAAPDCVPGWAPGECGHGTAVASVLAGEDDGAYVGVAPTAKIAAIRIGNSVCHDGPTCSWVEYVESDSEFTDALTYIHDTLIPALASSANPVVAVNASVRIGGVYTGYCTQAWNVPYADAIDDIAYGDGVPVVIAAGNDYDKTGVGAPACVQSATSVGATGGYPHTGDEIDDLAGYSDGGPTLDVVAPGGMYLADSVAGPHSWYSSEGTSAAAPVVAGVISLAADLYDTTDCTYDAGVQSALHFTGTRVDYDSTVPTHTALAQSRNQIDVKAFFSRITDWCATGYTGRGNLSGQDPFRIVDTRFGIGAPKATIGANSTLTVDVAAAIGFDGWSMDSVALNVTTTNSTGSGDYLTVWPGTDSQPSTSSLNPSTSSTESNAVWVPVGTDGTVKFYNYSGATDLIVDVEGVWMTDFDAGLEDGYHPVTPARLVDTRNGTGGISGPISANSSFVYNPRGHGGVPSSGVDSVVLNVTVTSTGGAGWMSVGPSAVTSPATSNQNWGASSVTRPTLAFAKLDTNGFRVYSGSSSAHYIVDVVGYTTTGATDPVSITPARIYDSRPGSPFVQWDGANVSVAGQGGMSWDSHTAVLSVTAADPAGGTFLSVFPYDWDWLGSNAVLTAGDTRANLVVAEVDWSGYISVGNFGPSTTDILVDTFGYDTNP